MTKTRSFGTGPRESHDSSAFYSRFEGPLISTDSTVNETDVRDEIFEHTSEDMHELPDNSVALMVTSPPYHAGKDYDTEATFDEYLDLLERVFEETWRVLEPGGRVAINVANLGRKPYIPLTTYVDATMLHLGFLERGQIIWVKGKGANNSIAVGTFQSPKNPVLRDVHEYILVYSKGRFDRVRQGIPTISKEHFLRETISVWEMRPESAKRVKHPAPFPVELPKRLIELYTYHDDVVLDPFMGVGATAVAAVETGRRYVGYDTEPAYCDTARERVAHAVEQRAVTI